MGWIPVEFLGFAKFRFYFKRDMNSEGFRWETVIISITSRTGCTRIKTED